MADIKALVDSGATDNFIHPKFVKRMGLGQRALDKPKNIYNIDDTTNKSGQITHYLLLAVTTAGTTREMRFLVTDIGQEDVLLGYPWLSTYEPRFSWRHGTIDEANLPIILRTINPTDKQEVIARYLSTDERLDILNELERTVGGEPSAIRNTAVDLAIKAKQHTKKVEIPREYEAYASVFSEEESHRFPPRRPFDHKIQLKPGAPDALNCKIYPMTREEDEALDVFIDDQLAKGYIVPSTSPYASSFFFIKKKDGKLRPVQDYRRLNEWTVRNQYPLPLISDLVRDLGGASMYSKFDVRQGYNNIRMAEEDAWKAAFKTRRGLYQPDVMYFGLCNSPATFQAFMDDGFRATIAKHDALGTAIRIYMDDIAVATRLTTTIRTQAEVRQAHIAAVSDILAVAKELDLYFKPEKCVFHATSIDYLGVILEKGVTRMDPIKIAGIRDWPAPTTVKQVRAFLGFCNFYRPFIRGFAAVARPLNDLTKKDATWHWGQPQQTAFETLKHRVTNEPILIQPDATKQFTLEVDASGYAIGAVLLQKGDDGKNHPVSYYSRTLNAAERNYDVYNRELLAMADGLDHDRPLLAGTTIPIIVLSDHINLRFWREPHKISRRIARLVLQLAEYNFEIHHIKGTANGRADALSRRPDYDQGEDDNQDVVVLPDNLFVRALTTINTMNDAQDENILKPWIDPHELKKIDGMWYKNARRVVTGSDATKKVIASRHDTPVHGHPGIARTINLIERTHWWPGLRREVTDYVKGCAECQRNKVNNRPTRASLEPIWARSEAMPFETVAIDFITKLPVSQGYDSILTVTDHDCSKAALFIPCVEEISGEETAALYMRHVFARFGLPSKIISDRDPRFASKFTRELCRILGIQQNISTAYHPRTDGQSERTNQWVEQYLRFWVNERQDDWAQKLPIAEFAHNNWINDTTHESPFHLLMGYHPRADWVDARSPIPQVTTRLEQFAESRRKAQELMRKAQQSWIKHRDTPKYRVGDQVWLEGRHLRTNQPTTKLAPRRHGPFTVAQVMSPVNYRLRLPTQWSIHDVFHTDLLTPYRETPTHGANYQRPPPDLVGGVEEYEVEKVLDSRRHGRGRKLQYLVKWLGYPDSDNEWVNWDDATGAEDAIREFKQRNPKSEVHIKTGRAQRQTSLPHPTLMSSSPSNTAHWNFDTEEAREAWAQADYRISKAAADREADAEEAARSALADDIITTFNEQAVHQRDLEEARRHFRTPEQARLSEDSTGGPPLLEEGGGGLAPGPAHPSAFAVATTRGILPASNGTPYPTIISLGSEYGGSDNDTADIQCGRCDAPIDYCHCDGDVLFVPPPPLPDSSLSIRDVDMLATEALANRVVHDLTQDDEETAISVATTEEEANTPVRVEVRVGRRVDGETDVGGRVPGRRPGPNPFGAPQRPARRPLSPAPPSFDRNVGHNYVPFRIPTLSGHGVANAKWVRVRMGINPTVEGCMQTGSVVYQGEVHAAPDHDHGPTPQYEHAQLQHFHPDYRRRHEVDAALERIGDKSLLAEVARYRGTTAAMERLNTELRTLEESLYCHGNDNRKCVRRLEKAHALVRVFEEEEITNGLRVITPWVVERRREERGRSA